MTKDHKKFFKDDYATFVDTILVRFDSPGMLQIPINKEIIKFIIRVILFYDKYIKGFTRDNALSLFNLFEPDNNA